jgi:excisionase family DNA binding protein
MIAVYLLPEEVAARLGFRTSTIQTWIRTGVLPALDLNAQTDFHCAKEGRNYAHPTFRIHVNDLTRFMQVRDGGLDTAESAAPPAPEPQRLLLSPKEIADLLRVKRETIYRLLRKGLRHHKIGHAVRIDPRDLQMFTYQQREPLPRHRAR